MKNLALILIAAISVLFTECKTKSKATTSTAGNDNNTTSDQGVKVPCRVAISFISIASGIDGAKYDEMEKYIQNHPKKPAFEVIPMGREGERDICMSLKEMNSSEQKDFVKELKKMAETSDRVKVNENTERTKFK
jgi:hypothetical protein